MTPDRFDTQNATKLRNPSVAMKVPQSFSEARKAAQTLEKLPIARYLGGGYCVLFELRPELAEPGFEF